MKIEKGKFYSIHYQAKTRSYMGSAECINAFENGSSGDFKLPDGNVGHFFSEDIVCEMGAYKLSDNPVQIGRPKD